MAIKIILSLLLLVFVAIQCIFIYWLGGYNPKELTKLLDLWQSFGVEITPYTAFILSIAKIKAVWLIPKFNIILGGWLIFKKEWYVGLLAVLLSLIVAMAFVLAVYNPKMMISLS